MYLNKLHYNLNPWPCMQRHHKILLKFYPDLKCPSVFLLCFSNQLIGHPVSRSMYINCVNYARADQISVENIIVQKGPVMCTM